MPPLAHHAPGQGAVSVFLALLFLAFAILYLRGWLRLRISPIQISAGRFFGFLSGLALLWAAAASSLSAYVHRFLTAHMIQHLLLMTVAPALILLGDPLKVFRAALPGQFVQSLGTLLPRPPLPRIAASLTDPIVCWLASTTVLMLWHIPAIFSRSFPSSPLHQFEQLTFVLAGFLFWWPVIQPWPSAYSWPRWLLLLYLFFATLPCDILSAYLTFCDRVVYAPYLRSSSPDFVLRDQQFAGALMWTSITIIYLLPALALTVRLLGRHQHEE